MVLKLSPLSFVENENKMQFAAIMRSMLNNFNAVKYFGKKSHYIVRAAKERQSNAIFDWGIRGNISMLDLLWQILRPNIWL